ncbi:hypothetical protein P3T20_005538 [Paraburkholderia sp. GAS206C]
MLWPQTGFRHTSDWLHAAGPQWIQPARYSPLRQGNALPSPSEIAVLAL